MGHWRINRKYDSFYLKYTFQTQSGNSDPGIHIRRSKKASCNFEPELCKLAWPAPASRERQHGVQFQQHEALSDRPVMWCKIIAKTIQPEKCKDEVTPKIKVWIVKLIPILRTNKKSDQGQSHQVNYSKNRTIKYWIIQIMILKSNGFSCPC